jgi:hypothetical protein
MFSQTYGKGGLRAIQIGRRYLGIELDAKDHATTKHFDSGTSSSAARRNARLASQGRRFRGLNEGPRRQHIALA